MLKFWYDDDDDDVTACVLSSVNKRMLYCIV